MYTCLVIFDHLRSLSIRKSAFLNIFWFGLFTGRHVGGLKEVLQHGGSILGSVILCRTFQQIYQLWDDAHTLNLENCLLYLLSTISQFFDFVRCIVFDFIFYCVTAHTLYRVCAPDVIKFSNPKQKSH